MLTATRNWKFYAERLSLGDLLSTPLRELPAALKVCFIGGDAMDGFVGLQVGPWSFGIEALGDERVSWSTPWRWMREQITQSGAKAVAVLTPTLGLGIGAAWRQ